MGIGPQGRLWVDSVIVSVDNEPPVLSLLEPLSVADHVEGGKGIVLVVEAADNLELEEVALFIDGVRVATSRTAPLTFRWEPAGEGAHTLFARALDKAGNVAISERMRLTLGP
jgi:chitinase